MSTPLRVGVVGCSNLGKNHAKNYLKIPGVTVAAICDLLPEPLAQMQAEVFTPAGQTPAQYHDYATMLAEAKLDAVTLIVPHVAHFGMAKAALECGLHVLIEKPMVTDLDEALKLSEIVERSGKVLNIAFQGAHSGQLRLARQVLAEGRIGEIIAIRAYLQQDWLNLVERMPQKRWRLKKADAGGGQLYDSGSHLFNAILWVTGLQPSRVYAELDNRDQEVDVNGVLTIRFSNGAIASVTILGATQQTGMGSEIAITGTDGDLVLPSASHGGKAAILHQRGVPPVELPLLEGESPTSGFVAAIRGTAPIPCPPASGVRLAALMQAVYQSASSGQPASVKVI
jgi:predicted dehydrogenase